MSDLDDLIESLEWQRQSRPDSVFALMFKGTIIHIIGVLRRFRWHSAEFPPTKEGLYIVYDDEGNEFVCNYNPKNEPSERWGFDLVPQKSWITNHSTITHWMYMIEPPKKKPNDN